MIAVQEQSADAAGLSPPQAELVGELRGLWARLPIPEPSWHPHVALIHACRDDFEHAIAAAADRPAALDLLAALIDGAPEPAFDRDASSELTGAWERLRALPLPEGQHPFLDEIVPALDALRLLLVALSQTGA